MNYVICSRNYITIPGIERHTFVGKTSCSKFDIFSFNLYLHLAGYKVIPIFTDNKKHRS